MLHKLLRREWILNRQNLILLFGIFIAYQIWAMSSMDSARAWVVMATLYAAFLTVVLFAREDKFRATGWSCTLPVKRFELIRARLVAAWLMVVVALAAATLLAGVLPWSRVRAADVFDPSTLLIVATVASLIFAWVMPFTIRFGIVGIIGFLVGGQVLAVTLLVVARAVHRPGPGNERPIRAVLAAIGEALVSPREALSPVLFALLVVLALIAVNWLTYRFSAYLFARREF